MIKFGRNYQIQIEMKSGVLLPVTLPLTIEFDIQRNALSSSNVASFRIYNLSLAHRNAIHKNLNDVGDLRTVSFSAGYVNNLNTCFSGIISQCYSYKQNKVDIITEIQSFDAGYAYVNSPQTPIPPFPKGTSIKAMLTPLLQNLPGNNQGQYITLGAIGNIGNGIITRAKSVSDPLDYLKNITGGPSSGFFIDLGKAFVLADNECIPAQGITSINADSGLLETPIWEQTTIHFPMLMETGIVMAQRLNLVSEVNPSLNGDYKVISLAHRGTISEAVCGEAITTIGLFAPLIDSELVDIPA